MAMKRVEQRPPHRLPRAARGQPGQRGRGRCCSRSPVWEGGRQQRGVGGGTRHDKWRGDKDSPNRVEATGAGKQGGPRETAAASMGSGGARQPRRGRVPARRSRGRDAGVAGGPVLRRTHFPEQTGTGQGVAGKRPLPESRREVWPRRREAVDSTEGPRQPPVWPAGEDTVRLAARPPPAGACSRFL